jgi:hypothetical protein
MTDFYISPAGTGTSGNGLTRNNPIVGLTNINNNAIGATNGDRLIFIGGTHYERFVCPSNGLSIISENAIWDGSEHINGSQSISTTTGLMVTNLSAWQQVDVGLNVWKKGCKHCAQLFINGNWTEPMPSSLITNNSATVLAAIQTNEWTVITETTDSQTNSLYIRLPSGTNPSAYDIRVSAPRKFTSDDNLAMGVFEVSQRTGISIEGVIKAQRVYNTAGFVGGIFIDRCVDFSTVNGQLYGFNCFTPIKITAGDRVRVRCKAEYSLQAIEVDAAKPVFPPIATTPYTAGEIEIYDWETNYCGWMPRYGGNNGNIAYSTDADGGVAIGYRGGTINSLIVRDGICRNGGPSLYALKTGWNNHATVNSVDIFKGSGVLVGTSDAMQINKLKITGNKIYDTKRCGIYVSGSNVTIGSVEITGNLLKRIQAFPGQTPTNLYERELIVINEKTANSLAGNHIIANNVISDSTFTSNLIRVSRQNASSTIKIFNNIGRSNTQVANCTASNRGNIWINDAFANISINGNIFDGGLNTGGTIRYGRINATIYETNGFTNWQAAGYDVNGYSGTVTIAEDGTLTAGTANPLGTGIKYWSTNARPSDINGEPFPDIGIDIGAVQSKTHIFHPNNL